MCEKIEGAEKKSKLKKKEQTANAIYCDLDFIYNWKRALYDSDKPEFPNFPIVKTKKIEGYEI